MNTAYKTIWNAAIGAWVAVCETACARGKPSTTPRSGRRSGRLSGRAPRLAAPLLAAAGFAMTSPAWAACVLAGATLDCAGTNPGWQGVANGGTINNTGSIATLGDGTWGVYVGSNVTVNNYGAISGTAGIVGGAGLVVNNIGGTIVSTERGIQSTGGAIALTNSNGGLVQGYGGALIYAGGTVLNTGNSVIDGLGYLGLAVANNDAEITNTAGSTIKGALSIYAQAAGIKLDNAGLLRGDVALDQGRVNQVTLRTGGQVQGNLTIGGAAGSTLTLAGNGTQVYSQAASGTTTFGGALIKNESGDWLLDRSFAPASVSVNAGALGFGAGGSFTASAAVSLAAGAKLYAVSGAAPLIGHLAGAAGSVVSLAAGASLELRDNLDSTVASNIGGAGTLIKRGTGVLALSGDNSGFGGTVTAYAGTLQMASQQALGNAALAIGGAVTLSSPGALALNDVNLFASGGTLAVQTPGAVDFSGAVSGAGSLDLRGIGGTVSLLGANTYGGGTRLAGNTVALGGNTALGSGAVAVEGNATLSGSTPLVPLVLANAFSIAASKTLTVTGASLALGGVVSGDGGIVKLGAGELALRGANSYAGATTVAAGTLAANNASGSATGTGAVLVQSGATLAGSGALSGDVTVGKGGILSAGNAGVAGGAGTLTVGNLNLAGGAVLNYDLGQAGVAGGTLNDLVNVVGNLQLDGTLNVAQTAGGTFGAGLYRLINYTGTLSDNGLDIGTAPTDAKNLQVQTSVAHQVNLVNADDVALNLWDGTSSAGFNDGKIAGGSGTWRAGSPGDNWTDVGGVANGTWKQDGFAIFSGAPGTVTVDNKGAAGPVRIGGAQFAVDGYTVDGAALTLAAANTVVRVGDGTAASAGMTATLNASLAGAGGLVKDDGGTLVLGAVNSYTGGTTVKGGVLQISTDSNLGAFGTGLALDGGTLRIAAGAAPFFSVRALALGAGGGTIDLSNSLYGVGGPITGKGLLTVTGKGGTLGLVSASSYSGGTVLKDGASITTTASGVLGSGAVQQQGNATVLSLLGTASAGGNAYTVARAASADSGNTLSFSQSATAGSASITLNGTGWSTPGSNTLQFGGSASAGASTIVNQGGAINIFDTASAGTATITNADRSLLAFGLAASAGSAAIANQAGGLVRFADSATGAQATLANAAGGTLDVSGATAVGGTAVGSLSGAGAVVLGATRLTLGGLNTNDTLSGTVSDKGSVFVQPGTGTGGSLVKVGSGTLTLSGANSYTGGTTVAAGTLSVNNASGSATGTGAVLVQGSATLAGSGAIAGAVTIAKGGILAAGNSPGTLTLGALTLAGGATLNYELGQAGVPGGALNDLVNVVGNLQLDGTLNIAQPAGGSFGPGLYRLFSYGGTLTDNGLDIGTAPGAASDLQVQTSVARQVNLVNRAGLSLNFWDGSDSGKYNDAKVAGGSGTWRAGSPQPSLDGWTDMDGKLNANWAQDQFAVFGGKGGTVTVDGGGGAVRIAGAQFAVDGYVVQGDGIVMNGASTVVRVGDGTAAGAAMSATLNVALTGAGGLSKEDAGRLVLTGANTYSGGTTVKGGVLQGSATSLQGNIVNNAEVAFAQDKTAGTYAGTLSGTGRVRKIGTGTLVLGGANSYTGGTLVDAGTLATSTTGALGSGPVSVAAEAALQFGGAASAGALAYTLAKAGAGVGSGSGSGSVGGSLRLQDSASAGTARIDSGASSLIAFADKASADKASITTQAGAQLRIDQAATGVAIGSLDGAGDIVLGAKALTVGGLNGDAVLSGAVTGAGGSLVKVGSGTLTLAGTASHGGETRVAMGTLKAGAAHAFSAASAGVVAGGATLDLAGFSQQMAGLSNAGTVSLAGSAPGTTLTLSGPYVGNDGVLRLGAKLDNPGIADRLVLDGAAATASGRTTVQVANLGGLGASTSGAGIELISARNGATTTAQTTKDAFVLSGGHVDAGAFEYRLYAGDANGSGENWYLRADAPPGGAGTPGMPGVSLPTYRAEASLFAALPSQLRQSDLGMLGNLRQRIGDDDMRGSAGASTGASTGASSDAPSGASSGTQGGDRRAWGRLISTDMNIRQGGTVSPHSEGRVTGLQAGTDLLATPDWRAGIYVGQLAGDARVSGFASGLVDTATGRNNLRSQYLGLYGTYAAENGFYADLVLQAGRHRYTLQPQLSTGISGKGNSLLASLEVGKAFALGSSGWSVEPQLQLIHRRQRLDDAQIAGAVVRQDADSGWIGRAGVRVKGSFATGLGTLQPYGRVNVYRSAKGNDVARFVNPAAVTPIGTAIGGTSTELAAGFTLAVSDRTSIYSELGKLWASGGATRVGSSINAAVGVRVRW